MDKTTIEDYSEKNSSFPKTNILKKFFGRIPHPFPLMWAYWFIFSLFAIVFIYFYSGFYMNLITHASHDDAYYFTMAGNIGSFKWLGNYYSILLSKMPGYAVFLIFSIVTKLPYLTVVALFYSIAVAFFLKCSLWMFQKTKLLSLIMGLTLLFNPVFASDARIYRNQLSAICFLVFMGAIIAMFNPNSKKENKTLNIILGLVSFLGVGFLFYSREENILYYGALALSSLFFLIIHKRINSIKRNLWLIGCGVAGVLFFGLLFASLNYHYYGRFVVCEKTSAPYSTVMKAFQQVDDPWQDPAIPKISPSCQKIEKIASVVPEFREMASIMCDTTNMDFKNCSRYLDINSMQQVITGSNIIPVSHFEWFWISTGNRAGYYSDAKKAAEMYAIIGQKINNAIKKGELNKREILVSSGPYFVTKDDIPSIMKVIPRNYLDLFFNSKIFSEKYTNMAIRLSGKKNKHKNIKIWAYWLKANYLFKPKDKQLQKAENSIYNKFWNHLVKMYSKIVVPLFHLATPLALLLSAFAIWRRKWQFLFPVLIIVAGYVAHFFLLSMIDVVVGYRASTNIYFLPSYAPIIATFFLSLSSIIYIFSEKKPVLAKNKTSNE